jgi:hypothetical protein
MILVALLAVTMMKFGASPPSSLRSSLPKFGTRLWATTAFEHQYTTTADVHDRIRLPTSVRL